MGRLECLLQRICNRDLELVPGLSYNSQWIEESDTVLSTGQTSLIVDPPNGRAPLRESAAAVRDYYFAHVEDHYIYHTVWDRCLTRGVPGSMLPAGYNNAYRFIQTPDTFTIAVSYTHLTLPTNREV